MKTLVINGRDFELSNKVANFYASYDNNHTRALDTCYEKPSKRKVSLFNNWNNWYNGVVKSETYLEWEYEPKFGIQSYNRHIFTLGMIIKYEGKWYGLWITPAHNYATELIFE